MNVHISKEEKVKILNLESLYKIMQPILLRENKINQDREHFWIVGLKNNNRILYIELISMGSVNQTSAEPMEVFSFALQKRAVKIILVHNHPSGDMIPSRSDKDITDRLIQTGLIVNTPVLDHLIITANGYLSFADEGILEGLERNSSWVSEYQIRNQIKKQTERCEEKSALQEKKRVAKILLDENEDLHRIVKITGLSIKVIKSL